MSDPQFLDEIYHQTEQGEAADIYAKWAQTYEAELAANGYVTPGRCAEALASIDPSHAGPVIDLGCGTGLGGLALKAAGFEEVDGVDFSPEMLVLAAKHGCYRHLAEADLTGPIEAPATGYAHAVAMGVISPGHAPAEAISHALALLPSGGALVFSLNDHALADYRFEAHINEVVDGGWADVVFKEYGPHIPARELNAMVYGLRKR
ncbi:MAG: methyltransferase domain-containing protein [Rhodobacteraceae bacterium]|nr:methyltransferase domain-containing protein [Paracoccaceae bacterium]